MSRSSHLQSGLGSQTNRRAGISSSSLLPNEPRIADPARQSALTAQFLLPNLSELDACMLAVRTKVDTQLQQLQPTKMGKPYPLGQCLEISQAVQKQLRTLEEGSLPFEARAGFRALKSFQRAGGAFRQVWGDLRGQYFQNAFQLGTLYVDVANDTVTTTKPKVEILPFEAAKFIPIRNFEHFRRVACSYWGGKFYPNHVLPMLAPHCPLIHVNASGRVQIHDASHYMLSLSRAEKFSASESVLSGEPMPPTLFQHISSVLRDAGHQLPNDAQQGQGQALQQCREQRAKRWYLDPRILQKVFLDTRQVNVPLARRNYPIDRSLFSGESIMKKVKIDNIDYEIDKLTNEAKTQLQNIQFVDHELARLQAHVAALQTARSVYLDALRSALPSQ